MLKQLQLKAIRSENHKTHRGQLHIGGKWHQSCQSILRALLPSHRNGRTWLWNNSAVDEAWGKRTKIIIKMDQMHSDQRRCAREKTHSVALRHCTSLCGLCTHRSTIRRRHAYKCYCTGTTSKCLFAFQTIVVAEQHSCSEKEKKIKLYNLKQ